MVVIAPELAVVFADGPTVRAAVGSDSLALPPLVAYDYGEASTRPSPFLLQRSGGRGFTGTTPPMHKIYVARVIDTVVDAAGLTGPDGQPLQFTAHNFRRIFATDALAADLPPHVIQKLIGHADVRTTQGYSALFPDDIVAPTRRSSTTGAGYDPARTKYRAMTDQEWDGFEDVAKRKIAIGDCMRGLRHQLRPPIRLRGMRTPPTRPPSADSIDPPGFRRAARRGPPARRARRDRTTRPHPRRRQRQTRRDQPARRRIAIVDAATVRQSLTPHPAGRPPPGG
jgi:hypothetical protein